MKSATVTIGIIVIHLASVIAFAPQLSSITSEATAAIIRSQRANILTRHGRSHTSLRLVSSKQHNSFYSSKTQFTESTLFSVDNESKTNNEDLTIKNGQTQSSSNIFGTQPTIVITPDESSEEIYASAMQRTIIWVLSAAMFGLGLFFGVGRDISEQFFAGYLLEQSLSVDNLLVFLLLFDYFKVPLASQDRVLNYGIYGAIVMRAIMIGLGAVALKQFHAVLLIFAGVLIYSSASVLLGGEEEGADEEDMSENKIVQFSRNLIDSSDKFDGDKFFTMMEGGVKKATPLFICMIAVEVSDVVFAVDSIPAVFGVTENPLVVFTSNMFAIMGLRSLYTILSKAASDLEYLEPAVAIVLGFIGCKMVAEFFGVEVPTIYSLGVVATMLTGGVGLSLWKRSNDAAKTEIN